MPKPDENQPGESLHPKPNDKHGEGLAKMFKDIEDDAPYEKEPPKA